MSFETYFDMALKFFSEGNYERALTCARRAYEYRKQDERIWELLAKIYERLGNNHDAMLYLGLISLHNKNVYIDILENQKAECISGLERAHTNPALAPFKKSAVFEGHKITFQEDVFLGENLPLGKGDSIGYWVGIYNEDNRREARSFLLDRLKKYHVPMSNYCDMTFDVIRANMETNISVCMENDEKCVLPVAGTEHFQELFIYEKSNPEPYVAKLAKYETIFFRLEKPTQFVSLHPFAAGKPISLEHNPNRKKLVLNILADGLSWAEQKKEDFKQIPNIIRFFKNGIIFNQNYSETEYTYPSLAAIESGMRAAHSQIFHDRQYAELETSKTTIAEQMNSLGYYCVNIQGDGEGIYNGATRGYDRLLINHYVLSSYVGVERTIRHLNTFSETDNFIFLHVTEPHPYNADMNVLEEAQVRLSLQDHLHNIENSSSVCLSSIARNQYMNRKRIQNMDRQLGYLFQYIQDNYTEEDYIVHLYSDHGCSIYSDPSWLLDEYQTSAALMIRGADIPKLGFINELTSTIDIYKIMGYYCHFPIDASYLDGNLPEALGGKKRMYTWSNSIFPGQTYKLCLRTDEYEFRLETEHLTRENGTVQIHPYHCQLFLRDSNHTEIHNEKISSMFMKWINEDEYSIFK